MPRKKASRPILWIVAGPNGSGKSSLYKDTEIRSFDGTVWIINPDQLAARIKQTERLSLRKANLAAVQRIEKWLKSSIDTHQTIGVETVLSTGKYRKLVRKAKLRQFEIRLIYVCLDSVERNIQRVKMRVKKGGHAVPAARIRERYTRSLNQLHWFLKNADQAFLFDNSRSKPKPIGEKRGKSITLDPNALPAIADIVRKIAQK